MPNVTSRPVRGSTAGPLLAGLLAAVALVAGPFAGESEAVITGALLLGFGVGWALLSLSLRWALVPAAAMGVTGAVLIVLAPGEDALTASGWVWPPLLLALVVWMVRRGRGNRLLYPVFAVLVLAAIGGGYETVRNATDPALAGARLIDVGGHRLSIRCTGTGGPTVVLEPGLGEPASTMGRWIAPDVARTTTVCVYDQAGHGQSDPVPAAGADADAARDLHVLLQRAHVPGPYVLAGHSLGGMFALSYAHRYPAEVGGVALVDSMHPQQDNAFAASDRILAIVPTLARMGLARAFFDPQEGRPTTQAAQLVADVGGMPAQLDRAAALPSLGDRPLIVVTAGQGSAPGWGAEQDDLATLSSHSTHRTVPGSTHASLVEDEADAAESGRAITDVVRAVRADSRSGMSAVVRAQRAR